MAGLMRVIRRELFSSSSSSSLKTLVSRFQLPSLQIDKRFCTSLVHAPNHMSKMRKMAFEGNLLRLIRSQIQLESEDPPEKPVTRFNSFVVDDRPGHQWITLRGKYGEREEIKINATMFDGSVPVSENESDDKARGVELHITVVVDILKEEGGDILQFVCSTWPACFVIQKVCRLKRDGMLAKPYTGPEFPEMDMELQDALQEFLDARGVNNELAGFLHGYMMNKGRTERIRWLGTVRSYVERFPAEKRRGKRNLMLET